MAEHETNCVVDLAAVTIMIPDKRGRRLETVRVGECVLAACSPSNRPSQTRFLSGGFGVPPVKASGRGRVADFPGGIHQQHVASTTADATDRQNTVNRL